MNSQTDTTGGYLDRIRSSIYVSTSIRSMDRARQRGDLPFVKVGRKILYKIADLDAWVESHRVSGLQPAADRDSGGMDSRSYYIPPNSSTPT